MSKIKVGLYLTGISVILAIGGYVSKYVSNLRTDNSRLYSNLVGKEQQYQQLNAYVAKLQIDYKSQEDLSLETQTQFKDQIRDLQGRIKVLSDSSYLQVGNTITAPKSEVIGNGFIADEVHLKNGPPLGYVKLNKDGSIESRSYETKIDVYSAISQDEKTGKYTVLNKADLTLTEKPINPESQPWLNSPYHLSITSGKAEIDPTQPIFQHKKLYWWNPKANINLNTNGIGLSLAAGVSLMSYGTTKNDSDFKFLELGLQDHNQIFEPILIPVLWRPFSGLMSNTYLGPGVYLNNSNLGYVLSVSVGL